MIVECVVPCAAIASVIGPSTIELPVIAPEHRESPLDLATLVGQRPLPNPLPPKH